MITWLVFGFVLSWQSLPAPAASWQITYDPSQALVTSMGETILFNGSAVYRYDASGSLQSSGTLTFAPERVFLDAEGYVLVHDGDQVLGRLNQNNGIMWQRHFPLADLPPFHYQGFLVYAVGRKLWLLEAPTGWSRYSLERDQKITAVGAYKNDLLIADDLGRLLQWDPLTGRRLWLRNKGNAPVHFLTVAGDRSLALVTADGELEILDEKRKTRWRRRFYIDISLPPLWFGLENSGQWVLATHGRNFYAFGQRGKLMADHLLPNRPMLLTAFDQTHALLIPYLSPQMVWYNVENRQFKTEILPAYQSLVIDQANNLLLVGSDGQIRLYKKTIYPREN